MRARVCELLRLEAVRGGMGRRQGWWGLSRGGTGLVAWGLLGGNGRGRHVALWRARPVAPGRSLSKGGRRPVPSGLGQLVGSGLRRLVG